MRISADVDADTDIRSTSIWWYICNVKNCFHISFCVDKTLFLCGIQIHIFFVLRTTSETKLPQGWLWLIFFLKFINPYMKVLDHRNCYIKCSCTAKSGSISTGLFQCSVQEFILRNKGYLKKRLVLKYLPLVYHHNIHFLKPQ